MTLLSLIPLHTQALVSSIRLSNGNSGNENVLCISDAYKISSDTANEICFPFLRTVK